MYFRSVSIFGLICAFLVALGILQNSFLSLASKGGGAFPILFGSLACFLCGYFLDRKLAGKSLTWKSKIFYAPVIFLSGVFVGCFLNFLLNIETLTSMAKLSHTFFDWFVKPFFWLCYIGIPASLIVGITCFGVNKFVSRNS